MKSTLRERLKKLDEEIAIYDWSLWRYHQRLHKRVSDYNKEFNRIYCQAWKGSKEIKQTREHIHKMIDVKERSVLGKKVAYEFYKKIPVVERGTDEVDVSAVL